MSTRLGGDYDNLILSIFVCHTIDMGGREYPIRRGLRQDQISNFGFVGMDMRRP